MEQPIENFLTMELFFPGEAKKFYFVKALDVNVSQNRKKNFLALFILNLDRQKVFSRHIYEVIFNSHNSNRILPTNKYSIAFNWTTTPQIAINRD